MFPNQSVDLLTVFPDAQTVLDCALEDLGPIVLELFHHGVQQHGRFSIYEVMYRANESNNEAIWPTRLRPSLELALGEAFQWLEQAGLIMPDLTQGGGTIFRVPTRLGRTLRFRSDIKAQVSAAHFPEWLMHPIVIARSKSALLRGEFHPAVFSAFHAVEVAVRTASGADKEAIGVNLMRTAFRAKEGKLANKDLPTAEQEAEANLFVASIGIWKNSASHRNIEMTREEATRLLLIASQLLFTVDARSA